MRNIILTIIFGILVTGCAVGNTHNYDVGDASFAVKSDKAVAVGTGDLRTYVTAGGKKPNFVGLRRGGFGNPFDVTTTSGMPLADDMTSSLVKSLESAGVSARAAAVSPGTDLVKARDELLQTGADRYLLLLLYEWKADTFNRTSVDYNITLTVFDRDGTELAQADEQGKDVHPPALATSDIEQMVVSSFRNKIEAMVNRPEIRSALE